jgi:type I restriction enzyme R subunit
MPLLELIVKTGIANAISSLPNGLKGNKNAVAETIENNVRSKIIREHLNDPAFYDKMSVLLDEIIAARKAKAIEYEEYLTRIAELVKKVEGGDPVTPESINTPGRRALYNNRCSGTAEPSAAYGNTDKDDVLELTIRIDETIRRVRPDDWRGHQARENEIKRALLPILHNDEKEVERIFLIIMQHKEY